MTTTFKRVCVGIDGSRDAEVALEWASRFAKRHDCRVEPIYTWEYPPLGYTPWPVGVVVPPESSMQDAAQRGATETFERWKTIADPGSNVDAPIVTRGSTGSTLVRLSADANLLVVGSRGLGAVKGLIIGSVSSYVAAHATCPVAIIPTGFDDPRIDKIVVGHDGSEHADAALQWTIDAYPGSAVEIVHVWHMPTAVGPMGMTTEYNLFEANAIGIVERAKERIEDRAKAAGCAVSGIALLGDARMELNRRALDADLLVIGVQAAHGLRRVFMGSVAQAVVHHITVPTVLVPVGTES